MLFGSNIKLSRNNDIPDVKIKNSCVEQVNSFKYLGVYLDPSITWTGHLKHITNTVNRKLGLIYRSRNFLNSNILKTVDESFIIPNLDYCDVVWSNACHKYISKLNKLHNRAGKTILRVNKMFPTDKDCLKWKTLLERRNYHLYLMLYKCIAGQAPSYLCDTLVKVAENSPYCTRGSVQGNLIYRLNLALVLE